MENQVSRRAFLKLTGVVGGAFILTGCGSKNNGTLSLLDRIQGNPLTELPQIEDAWILEGDTLTLDLSKLPELESLGGAVRVEGTPLAEPVLVVYGEDGNYYSFQNACTHAGRMLDPVAGTMTLQCCSISQSTFDYQGEVVSGPAENPLTSYPITVENDFLIIQL